MTEAILQGLQTLIAQGGYTAAAVIAAYFVGRAIIWGIVCFTIFRLATVFSASFQTYSRTRLAQQQRSISLVSENVSSDLSSALREALGNLAKAVNSGSEKLADSAERLEKAAEALRTSRKPPEVRADGTGGGDDSKTNSTENTDG